MSQTKYNYNKEVDINRLIQEIQDSEITIALDYINAINEESVDIFFKDELPSEQETILDNIIGTHEAEPLPQDIVTNVKITDENKDDFGNLIFAPTLDDSLGLTPKKQSYRHDIMLGEINFFDIPVTTEKRICGGEYWIRMNGNDYVHEDDIVEFSIIDKNNVLGLFDLYGLDDGSGSDDFLELSKFIINDYVYVGKHENFNNYYKQCYEGIKGTSLVTAGLFFRIKYESFYEPQSGDDESIRLTSRIYYYE